jgi:hypothetical protein
MHQSPPGIKTSCEVADVITAGACRAAHRQPGRLLAIAGKARQSVPKAGLA